MLKHISQCFAGATKDENVSSVLIEAGRQNIEDKKAISSFSSRGKVEGDACILAEVNSSQNGDNW